MRERSIKIENCSLKVTIPESSRSVSGVFKLKCPITGEEIRVHPHLNLKEADGICNMCGGTGLKCVHNSFRQSMEKAIKEMEKIDNQL